MEEMKMCPKCGIEKPNTAFYKKPQKKSGLDFCCKVCASKQSNTWRQKNKDRVSAQARKRYQENPDHHRENQLRYHFGMSLEDYAELLQQQGGVCAICKKKCVTGKRLAVDHNHITAEVRGLLCYRCNTSLGKFEDSPKLLQTAIEYLEKADPTPAGLMPCY